MKNIIRWIGRKFCEHGYHKWYYGNGSRFCLRVDCTKTSY